MPRQLSNLSHSARFLYRFLLLGLLVFGSVWLYLKLANLGFEYEWQWNRAWRQLGRWTNHGFAPGPLLDGILFTLAICALSLVLSFIMGFITAISRLSPWPGWALFAGIYVTVIRSTPLLIQLYFIYFLVAPLFSLDSFWSAVLALTLFEGAYLGEVFRSALLSVPRTQWEASLSLGLSLSLTLFQVILPQAIRNSLPALANQAVSLIKDTSLVGAIALADLTMQAQAIVAETFLAFEIWLIVALIYLVMSLIVVVPAFVMEHLYKWR